jgi:molecular chaperone GrpE
MDNEKKNKEVLEEEVLEVIDDIDEAMEIDESDELLDDKNDEMSVEQLKEKLNELETENEKLKNQFQRSLADYANLKLRTERERLNLLKSSNADLICKLLPVIDNFNRAIKAKDDDTQSIGISMIYKQLNSILEEEGLKKIEAEGKEFDPNLHDALMMEENDEYKDGTIIEVFEPGYMFKDKLIRTAKVKVSSNKEDK